MLGHRLATIAHQVPKDSRLADIGTDHGLIPVYLVKNKIVSKAIAADISEGSLRKAKGLIKDEGLDAMIESRLGPGLQVIHPGEVDTVLIAGMGGMLIKQILQDGSKVLESITILILQPMNAQAPLRRWLVENSFTINHEVLVRDNKHIYEIIVAQHGHQEVIDDIQYEIGFKFLENKDPLFKEFIEQKIARTDYIIDQLMKENTQNAGEILRTFTIKLEKYEEARRLCTQSGK